MLRCRNFAPIRRAPGNYPAAGHRVATTLIPHPQHRAGGRIQRWHQAGMITS